MGACIPRRRGVGLGVQETLGLAVGMAMTGGKPARVLLLHGLPRDQGPLTNTPAQGALQDLPRDCWQEGGGVLGGVIEGTSALGRG